MDGACSTNGGETVRLLVGKLEGKKTLERPRLRWMNDIKIDLGEIE
jgi:hypothetical protein